MTDRPFDLNRLRQTLGGRLYDNGRRWIGPGPGHSKRDASLAVRLTDGGKVLLHSFAGDSFEACAAHVGLERGAPQPYRRPARRLTPFERQMEASARFNAAFENAREATRRLAFRTACWAERAPLRGSPAEAYLGHRRLAAPDCPDLAYHRAMPSAYEGGARRPCLLAPARKANGEPAALHATPLSLVNGKRERRMFGPARGAAVRLAPVGDDGVLAVAEGIETALAFTALCGIPCWAALSAPGVAAFRPPPGVTRLIAAPDGDKTGREAALVLARRVSAQCDVDVAAIDDGLDWNDVLLREARR